MSIVFGPSIGNSSKKKRQKASTSLLVRKRVLGPLPCVLLTESVVSLSQPGFVLSATTPKKGIQTLTVFLRSDQVYSVKTWQRHQTKLKLLGALKGGKQMLGSGGLFHHSLANRIHGIFTYEWLTFTIRYGK